MIHVYALTAVPLDLGDLVGVDGRGVRPVACPPLHAVVSDHGRAPGPTRGRALAHARVVAAAGEAAPAVPVQYGARHADETALRAAVRERAGALSDTLARVGGHVEVVVRFAAPVRDPASTVRAGDGTDVAGDPAPSSDVPAPSSDVPDVPAVSPDAAGSGRAYLEGRRERERAERAVRRAARQRLRERTAPFEPLASEAADRSGPRGPERCLLVPDAEVAPLLAAARAAADADGDLVVGGPWPPYTFASQVVGDG